MLTLPQMTTLTACCDFDIKPVKGRTIKVKAGDKFAVTNSSTSQRNGVYMVDRSKRATIGSGHGFTWDMLVQFFGVTQATRDPIGS